MATATRAARRKTSETFDASTRFNWGRHDAQADKAAGRQPLWTAPHFDADYEAGYRAGLVATEPVTK